METKRIKTGIFGGSFNPIHIGHLALANYLCEFGELDEIWFMVSPHNPLKQQQDLWNDELRLKLVEMSIEGYPKFRASDFEFHLPRPSYMVNTLAALKEAYPEREFTLIIGSDNWTSFPKWKDPEIIMQNFPILIYPRIGHEVDESLLPPTIRLVQTPLIEVSSTFIRESMQQGKDVRFFLNPQVYSYLQGLPPQSLLR